MTPVTVDALEAIVGPHTPRARLELFVPHLNEGMERFSIDTPERQAAFIPTVAHESALFTRVVEDFTYTHADRIALIFRSHFDKDHNGEISKEELAFAEQFVRQPEKMANFVYANRLGNGDEASGDGFRFRGRGLIQITGRANYMQVSIGLFGNQFVLVTHPQELEQPRAAALSAAFHWERSRCNELADEGDFRGITKVINGGYNGYAARAELYAAAKGVLI